MVHRISLSREFRHVISILDARSAVGTEKQSHQPAWRIRHQLSRTRITMG